MTSSQHVYEVRPRNDAVEKTSRQIVDEKGNWIGVLHGHVIHHAGKTDEEVWSIVTSLNNKRRHNTTGQLAAMADGLATAKHGGDRRSDQSAEIHIDSPMTVAEAAKVVGTSTSSVRQFRRVKKAAPEKIKDIRAGQLAPSKAVSDLSAKGKSRKKEIAFADQVYHKWTLWVNRFDLKQRLEVMQLVHSWTKPEKVRRYCA